MTTDITELAQSHELLIANGQQTADLLRHLADNEIDSDYFAVVSECESYGKETDAELSITEFALRAAGYVDELVEALEKAQQQMTESENRVRKQNRHICELFDDNTALRQRIAELESRAVKLPLHPTVASEKLDDETLQELIEFRRTTFEYHSKEGNKVRTIIHGVTLAALRELQERRKADSEPVAWTDEEELRDVNVAGIGYLFGIDREANKFADPRRQIMLYRHAQLSIVPDAIPVSRDIDAEYLSGWNDCRAAMLKKENATKWWHGLHNEIKGRGRRHEGDFTPDISMSTEEIIDAINKRRTASEPATVPGKWIPVSEKLPEDEQEVLTRNRFGHCFVSFFDENSGLFFDRLDAPIEWSIEHVLVTHWMPLPPAPMEVK